MEINNLLLFVFLLALYFALHSVLANQKVKSWLIDRWIDKRYYRILYNVLAVVLLLPIAWVYLSISSHLLFEYLWLNYIGLGISLFGMALLFVALSQYDLSEFSGTQQLRANKAPAPVVLRTDGLNGIVRHPLYFSGLLILWGWFLFRPTDLYLVLALVATLYIYVGTKLEEQKLVVEFGEAYVVYQKDVGMLLPWVRI